jgi:hypothetical protein
MIKALGVAPTNANDEVTKAYTDAGDARITPKVNSWIVPVSGGGSGSGAPGVNLLKLCPWLNRGTITIKAFGVNVVTAGAATSLYRMGIYNDDGSGYPGTLVVDSGQVDCTTTGAKSITLGTSLVLPAGLYWIGGVAQGTSGGQTITITGGSLDFIPGYVYASLTTTISAPASTHSYTQSAVTGALPGTFSTTLGLSGNGPRLLLGL